jgi:hypothetical protein
VWLEERLFEILGGWVPSVPEHEVKLALSEASFHHAWHAALWRERLPELRELTEPFVAPPGPGVVAVLTALGSAVTTMEKLLGIYRVVVPHQIAIYRRHLEAASAITDGPAIRALTLVLADDRSDQAEGERLIGTLGPDAVAAPGWEAELLGLLR